MHRANRWVSRERKEIHVALLLVIRRFRSARRVGLLLNDPKGGGGGCSSGRHRIGAQRLTSCPSGILESRLVHPQVEPAKSAEGPSEAEHDEHHTDGERDESFKTGEQKTYL